MIVAGGEIEYCYNSGKVSKSKKKTLNGDYDNTYNRLGGICGAGAAMKVMYCYNVGTIEGYGGNESSPMASPIGGIIGYLSDNTLWLKIMTTTSKYLRFEFSYLGLGSFSNVLSNCYNAGELIGEYENRGLFDLHIFYPPKNFHYNGGIIGFIGWGWGDTDELTLTELIQLAKDAISSAITGQPLDSKIYTQVNDCFYWKRGETEHGTNNLLGVDKAEGKTADELKQILYNWASKPSGSGGQILPGTKDTYIYNTTAPVEKGLGFEGYGILWWQLDGYERTTFHVYDKVGVPIYKNITLHIGDSKVNLENYFKLNCIKGYNTYGYILMLNNSNEYTSKATNSNYTEDAGREITVDIGNENDVYIGKRPEFILAINNNNNNNKNITRTENIPAGDYYIIACGGRRLFCLYTC